MMQKPEVLVTDSTLPNNGSNNRSVAEQNMKVAKDTSQPCDTRNLTEKFRLRPQGSSESCNGIIGKEHMRSQGRAESSSNMGKSPIKSQSSAESCSGNMGKSPIKSQGSAESCYGTMGKAPIKSQGSAESCSGNMGKAQIKSQGSAESCYGTMDIRYSTNSQGNNNGISQDKTRLSHGNLKKDDSGHGDSLVPTEHILCRERSDDSVFEDPSPPVCSQPSPHLSTNVTNYVFGNQPSTDIKHEFNDPLSNMQNFDSHLPPSSNPTRHSATESMINAASHPIPFPAIPGHLQTIEEISSHYGLSLDSADRLSNFNGSSLHLHISGNTSNESSLPSKPLCSANTDNSDLHIHQIGVPWQVWNSTVQELGKLKLDMHTLVEHHSQKMGELALFCRKKEHECQRMMLEIKNQEQIKSNLVVDVHSAHKEVEKLCNDKRKLEEQLESVKQMLQDERQRASDKEQALQNKVIDLEDRIQGYKFNEERLRQKLHNKGIYESHIDNVNRRAQHTGHTPQNARQEEITRDNDNTELKQTSPSHSHLLTRHEAVDESGSDDDNDGDDTDLKSLVNTNTSPALNSQGNQHQFLHSQNVLHSGTSNCVQPNNIISPQVVQGAVQENLTQRVNITTQTACEAGQDNMTQGVIHPEDGSSRNVAHFMQEFSRNYQQEDSDESNCGEIDQILELKLF